MNLKRTSIYLLAILTAVSVFSCSMSLGEPSKKNNGSIEIHIPHIAIGSMEKTGGSAERALALNPTLIKITITDSSGSLLVPVFEQEVVPSSVSEQIKIQIPNVPSASNCTVQVDIFNRNNSPELPVVSGTRQGVQIRPYGMTPIAVVCLPKTFDDESLSLSTPISLLALPNGQEQWFKIKDFNPGFAYAFTVEPSTGSTLALFDSTGKYLNHSTSGKVLGMTTGSSLYLARVGTTAGFLHVEELGSSVIIVTPPVNLGNTLVFSPSTRTITSTGTATINASGLEGANNWKWYVNGLEQIFPNEATSEFTFEGSRGPGTYTISVTAQKGERIYSGFCTIAVTAAVPSPSIRRVLFHRDSYTGTANWKFAYKEGTGYGAETAYEMLDSISSYWWADTAIHFDFDQYAAYIRGGNKVYRADAGTGTVQSFVEIAGLQNVAVDRGNNRLFVKTQVGTVDLPGAVAWEFRPLFNPEVTVPLTCASDVPVGKVFAVNNNVLYDAVNGHTAFTINTYDVQGSGDPYSLVKRTSSGTSFSSSSESALAGYTITDLKFHEGYLWALVRLQDWLSAGAPFIKGALLKINPSGMTIAGTYGLCSGSRPPAPPSSPDPNHEHWKYFYGPTRFVAILPDKLVISDEGVYRDSVDKQRNRVMTFTIDSGALLGEDAGTGVEFLEKIASSYNSDFE